MALEAPSPAILRFGVFEVDLRSGELRKQGVRIKLQEQPFHVLTLLLQRHGEVVSREDLRSKIWRADSFIDFDSGLNTSINKLREALDDSAASPRFIETLPRRGYRFIAPVETPALDWAAPPIEGAHPGTSLQKRWLLASAAVLLGIALLSLAWGPGGMRARLMPGRAQPSITSLAVLPLQNLSGDPAQEYFSDGLTDELITEVARISTLRVISRTSSMQYKGTHKSLPVIARELGVDAVVEGTVVRSGDQVRITTQLIQASDDRHLWSEKYQRNLGDVLTLQGEVAQAIADQIRVKLTAEEHASLGRARPMNPQAIEAYLKGYFFLNKGTEGLEKSIEFFTQAILVDPSNSQAYAGLSQSYVYLGVYGLRPSKDVYPKAGVAAMKAVELDDTVAEAHSTLADIKKGYDWDLAGAGLEYKRALELNSNSSLTHASYADYLAKLGRPEEAIAEARRARELDPISEAFQAFLGFILYRARKYDEAIAACHKALELNANYPNAYWFLAFALEQKREFPEAIAILKKAVSVSDAPLYRALIGHAYALAGERAAALSILDELQVLSKQRYVSPLDIALVYTGLGDRNSAFQWLERAYGERVMRIQELAEPHFDSLRPDPRFEDLLQRIGLPPSTSTESRPID